jgi:hypothetical protein
MDPTDRIRNTGVRLLQTTSGTSLNLWDSFYRESVRCRVEALLTARAAAHLDSLQVNDARKYSTGRAWAAS